MLAALCAHPRPGLSSADASADRKRARELFDKITRTISLSKSQASKALGEDWQMYADIARLWQTDNLERAGKAYLEAARIEVKPSPTDPAVGVVDPRLSNNLGVIRHLEGDVYAAQTCYQDAITVAAVSPTENDAIITTVMYNLARVYEEQGEVAKAREAYDKLLGKHPEYVDGASSLTTNALNFLDEASFQQRSLVHAWLIRQTVWKMPTATSKKLSNLNPTISIYGLSTLGCLVIN
jgi:RNA polymerase-associated protein CTR9